MAALFCKSSNHLYPNNFHRNYEIQLPFSSISTTSNFCISRISISAPPKFTNYTFENIQKDIKCCSSNLNSQGEFGKVAAHDSGIIIFIKGLAQSTSERGLKAAFSQFGEVSRVKIVNDKKTKQSLGFAYIWFKCDEHGRACVEEMNGKFFEGRFIYVTIAKPGSCKTRQDPSPYKF